MNWIMKLFGGSQEAAGRSASVSVDEETLARRRLLEVKRSILRKLSRRLAQGQYTCS
jgi:hypothetical protein